MCSNTGTCIGARTGWVSYPTATGSTPPSPLWKVSLSLRSERRFPFTPNGGCVNDAIGSTEPYHVVHPPLGDGVRRRVGRGRSAASQCNRCIGSHLKWSLTKLGSGCCGNVKAKACRALDLRSKLVMRGRCIHGVEKLKRFSECLRAGLQYTVLVVKGVQAARVQYLLM